MILNEKKKTSREVNIANHALRAFQMKCYRALFDRFLISLFSNEKRESAHKEN